MNSFPLYDILLKDVQKNDTPLTREEKRDLKKIISKLDQKGHERLFLIIRVHSLRNKEQDNIFDIPYNGKKNENNIEFDIEKMPSVVVQMLYKFVNIHLQTMKEDEEKSAILMHTSNN